MPQTTYRIENNGIVDHTTDRDVANHCSREGATVTAGVTWGETA